MRRPLASKLQSVADIDECTIKRASQKKPDEPWPTAVKLKSGDKLKCRAGDLP
jgi:hypothetical protein